MQHRQPLLQLADLLSANNLFAIFIGKQGIFQLRENVGDMNVLLGFPQTISDFLFPEIGELASAPHSRLQPSASGADMEILSKKFDSQGTGTW